MTMGTTPRQMALLRYIHGYQRAKGISPAFREMASAVGSSRSGVFWLLGHLEQRGFIRRLPHRERAIEVLIAPSIPSAPDGAPLYAVPLPEAR